MSRVSIIFGIILIILGGVAYALTTFASWTALIPAILGLVLILCGVLGFLHEPSGAILGLLTAVAGMGGTINNLFDLAALFAGNAERPLAVVTSTITFVLLVSYTITAIRRIACYAQRPPRPARSSTYQ